MVRVYLQFQAPQKSLYLVQVNLVLALFFHLAGVIDLMEVVSDCITGTPLVYIWDQQLGLPLTKLCMYLSHTSWNLPLLLVLQIIFLIMGGCDWEYQGLRRLRDLLDMKVKGPLFDIRNGGKPVLSTVLELLQTNGKDKCSYWRELLLSVNPIYSSERYFALQGISARSVWPSLVVPHVQQRCYVLLRQVGDGFVT